LREESGQIALRRTLEGGAQILPRSNRPALLAPERAETLVECVAADRVTQHHEQHRGLVIADDLVAAMRA
jgi:hypothetical protein